MIDETRSVDGRSATAGSALATRRTVLAAGGTIALASLAGCTALDGLVDRASQEAVANRAASPAAFYAGVAPSGATAYRSDPVDVRFVPPTLRAESRRIDVDGWSTSSTTRAQDYNSSRSNKPSTVWVPDPLDDDSDGDGIPTLAAALDAERALVVYASAAITAVEGRSSGDATTALDGFDETATTVRSELERCGTDRCRSVAENLVTQQELAGDAREAVDAGDWDAANRSLRQARRIAQGDADDILDGFDSDGDGFPDFAAPLYGYLDGEPTVAEHFVVSLPDARVRGGGPALADEITPKRVLDYFLGEKAAERCGGNERGVAVHRDLACRDLLTARLDESRAKQRHVAAFELSGGAVVTGATPTADESAPMLRVAPDNGVSSDDSLDSWGTEETSDGTTVSSVLVCPVDATPADCPCPMPALFHVRRIRHADQLLFVGGWTIDDGALYEHGATVLTAEGPNRVVAVTYTGNGEGGGIEYQDGDDLLLRKRPGRTKFGNITLSKAYKPDAEYLPPGAREVCTSGGDGYLHDLQSRVDIAVHATGGCPGEDGDATAWSVVTALDAPVVHLAADGASNEVKFKAGAELSKAVN